VAGAASAAVEDAAPAADASVAAVGEAPALAAEVAEAVAVEVRIPCCRPRVTAVSWSAGLRPPVHCCIGCLRSHILAQACVLPNR